MVLKKGKHKIKQSHNKKENNNNPNKEIRNVS